MAKNLFVCGTMSGVGKSYLVTGLCRYFANRGFAVAPFKSQNMALNSYVTWDGLEMGRAQAVQAFAAKKEPDVRMNPILLKPESDVGSQVILNGEVAGRYQAREYFKKKKDFLPLVLDAYRSIEAENDVVLIEGAGSPAEINLKENDIVNMGLAEAVDAPVLLVGDIDPGGVFAQLYGTYALLSPEERKRIRGMIINKFRGDPSLLSSGIKMLEEKTNIPVLGVLPFLQTKVEEEDSMAGELQRTSHHRPLDVAILRFPHISNFTDFEPLVLHPDIGIRYVWKRDDLGTPDLLILPGTKSTLDDLRWLRKEGLDEAVTAFAKAGGYVLGICGGYQILGETLSEEGRTEAGLGLLSLETEFAAQKLRTQVSMELTEGFLKGSYVEGYEIHMGRSEMKDAFPPNVYGTYLHGLFDTGSATACLAALLGEKRGIPITPADLLHWRAYQDAQYDQIADMLEEYMDMETITDLIVSK